MENKQSLEIKHFLNGRTWSSYAIDEIESYNVTPAKISLKFQDVLGESYNVQNIDFMCYEDLMCFMLNLEELPSRKKKRKRKKDKIELKTYSFRLAISIDDSLLFCQRSLPNSFQDLFGEVFGTTLIPFDLSGSPPYELLLFHRQARDARKNFHAQLLKLSLDGICDGVTTEFPPIMKKIGPGLERIPKINKLTSNFRNVPLNSSDEALMDKRMTSVEIEFSGHSILDAYLQFGNLLSCIPKWLVECRSSGKTHRNLLYQ